MTPERAARQLRARIRMPATEARYAARKREVWAERIAAGLCPRCGAEGLTGRYKRCLPCRIRQNAHNARHRAKRMEAAA